MTLSAAWWRSRRGCGRVILAVAANAQPGPYTVWFGFYDPDTGQRIPMLDRQGAPLVDSQLALTTLQVAATSSPP